MSIDTKHEDLQSLRIDRSHRNDSDSEPPKWSKRYILGGIAVVVLLGLIALAYRIFSPAAPELEVVRAVTEGGRGCGRRGAFRERLHCGSSQDQRELKSDGPREMDRRRERRQGEGRPGARASGRRRVPRAIPAGIGRG